MTRKQKQLDFENSYVDKIAFLNELYQERIAFLATFRLPGYEDEPEATGGEGSSFDGDMEVNMDGVPLPANDFLKKILPGAIKGYAKYNILPSLTLAQAALESGWGKHGIGNNVFGIKAGGSWTGKTQTVTTHEEYGGVRQKIQAAFRDYDSIDHAVLDHAKVLSNERYAKVRSAKDYKEAAYAVKAAGYATDSQYPQKLISTIEKNALNTWDDPKYKSLVDFKSVGTANAKGNAKIVIDYAQEWLNKTNRYVFGGGRSSADIKAGRFDCSSWCRYIFEQAGYDISGGNGLWVNTDTIMNNKSIKTIKTSELAPGDLMYFDTYKTYGHITICLGNGKAIGTQDNTGVAVIDYINNNYWKSRISNKHKRVF